MSDYYPMSYNHSCPYDGTCHLQEFLLSCWLRREAQACEHQMRHENGLLCTPLLFDVDNNSCSYHHSCTHNHSVPDYHTVPNNHPSPNYQLVHMQKLLLPCAVCVGTQARGSCVHGPKWVLH